MKKVVLEGKYLSDRETAHEYLKEVLDLPKYYGKNLDALYDCLTDLEEISIEIRVTADRAVEEENTAYFEKILRVFKAAARENQNLTIKLILETE